MSDEKEQTVTIPVSEYLELLKHKPDGKSSLAVRTGSVLWLEPSRWSLSCDNCAHQEGRHYCLLHGVSARDMDMKTCDEWTEWKNKDDSPNTRLGHTEK